jgi:hypothetical protein
MWIFTRHGFISAVSAVDAHGNVDAERVVVRARTAAHLEAILTAAGLPEALAAIRYSPERDYAYRVVLEKAIFVTLVAAAADSLDYPNFKSACQWEHPDDRAYHRMLGTTWQAGYTMQAFYDSRPDDND